MTETQFKDFLKPKMAVIAALGVASGLPSPLLGDAMKAWATDLGVDLGTVAALSLLTVPLGLKFLWSPLLDRPLGKLPRRKGWIFLFQLLVAAGIATLGFCNPSGSLAILGAIMLGLAFLSASQDVVIDAYRADRLTESEVGFGSACATSGWRIGYLLSGSLIFLFAKHLGWQMAFLLMAGVHASTAIATLLAVEPATASAENAPPQRLDLVAPFAAFIRQHGMGTVIALLAFAAVFKASDGFANGLAVPFLQKCGYGKGDLALRGGLGMPMAIVGGFIGGVLLPKLGFGRSLLWGGILQALSNLVYLPLALLPVHSGFIVLLVVVENVCAGLAVAAFMGFLLTCCSRTWSATQYALLTAIMFLGAQALGAVSGMVMKEVGQVTFFLISVAAGIPGLLLLPLVLRRRNQFTDAVEPRESD
jgi:MFS transporter, PAT family, beta-lactamase induction signal transducer AmpG